MKRYEMMFLSLMLITVIVLLSSCTMVEQMQARYQEMTLTNHL